MRSEPLRINNLKTKNYEQKNFHIKERLRTYSIQPVSSITISLYPQESLISASYYFKNAKRLSHLRPHIAEPLYISFKELSQYKYNKNF